MRYKTVCVEVDMDEWYDDELIKELNERGYQIVEEEQGADLEEIKDDIAALYNEWLDDQGDRDNRFEKSMRKFFEKHLNKVSV